MDFSEVFKYSGICKFSPNGKYIASSSGYRLVIKDVESLQVLRIYTCSDVISQIEWSADNEFILCAQYKRACVEVWSISDNTWKCKIEEGPAGVSYARFSPDSRHVLVTADFQLRITIWSILKNNSLTDSDEFSGHVAHIKYPKFTSKGIDFTPNGGKYMALAERRDCKDYISIIVTETWELVKHFPVRTKNLADLKWSPDGRFLVVWDHQIEYSVTIYSPAGSEIAHYSAYNDLLGVKSVKWSPNGQLLSIGSFDQKARILNHLTWKLTATYDHSTPVSIETHPNNPVVFQEVEFVGTNKTAAHTKTRYVIAELPINLKTVKAVDYKKANPQEGVGLMDWSCDSKYFFTRNDSMPNTLWIWETSKLSLCSLIVQTQPIRYAQWDPVHVRLAICTGNGKIYIWSREGCSCVDIPSASFNVQNFKWNSDGESMLLMDSAAFCVCYPSIESC